MKETTLDSGAHVDAAMAAWAAAVANLMAETERISCGHPVDLARMSRLNAQVDSAKHAYERAKGNLKFAASPLPPH